MTLKHLLTVQRLNRKFLAIVTAGSFYILASGATPAQTMTITRE